jgi:hypothetical protein
MVYVDRLIKEGGTLTSLPRRNPARTHLPTEAKMVTQNDALIALQSKFLFFFVWRAFGHLHPAQEFGPRWHIRAICHALMKVAVGETRRLLITVPPRYGKSVCAWVALPAWMLGINPALKIIVASHGGDLATKPSRDFRDVLNSDWYRALFSTSRIQVEGTVSINS